MMDNYSEQIVKKRVNPAKFTFLILYFVFAFIFILLTVYLSQFFDWMIPIALLIIGFGCYGGWYLWSHKGIEYEYIVVQGEMTVDKIIGMKKRKRMLKFDVKSVDMLGKLSEKPADFDEKQFKDCVYHATDYTESENTYYAALHDIYSKKHCLLYFAPNEKTLETMKPFLKRELKVKIFGK